MPFQIHALDPAPFAPLFAMPDDVLTARGIRHMTIDGPGTPCRISLRDAAPGETVLLLNHMHQPAATPYRSSHAIYIREGAAQVRPAIGSVPEVLQSRLVSLRLFDAGDMMTGADVVDGRDLSDAITRAFTDRRIAYIHLHFAKPGCFAASATRA